MPTTQTRRQFLRTVALASAAGVVGARPTRAAEATLETTTLRLTKAPVLCTAPLRIAEELLRADGFADIRYVESASAEEDMNALGSGKADLSFDFAPAVVGAIDAGVPVTVLSGAMAGCVELFAAESIRTVADLRGKRVGLRALGTTPQVVVSLMAAQVGIAPATEIDWVVDPSSTPSDLFVSGKVDAFVTNPPESLELRARRIGRVIVATAIDRPWSQYFCCMLVSRREYIRNNPIATKRAMRAILKATDLCAAEPAGAARQLVDRGFAPRYDLVLQTLTENAYDKWREYDAEDTMRFYALRMREAGFTKLSPQKIIAEGTDWRFLNELKRELKA